ncbi:type II toxin-antitoxin system CcdA family antitoxin [Geomonas anaerohicana]|uniref:Type II toxin-antitoxin system CcdA family antitoxin n=1 Tax=Geomonas anaerohicana TaxID=2798583 RepID=A0ABS0YF32_9BACT|nr:type II toxin-antitoxin system CcdA family antitoxin [Geomonas anaerohicana]MBJ6750930.1 type II toxin-antitoxin system CcdA family antitoxin [Geomonas anaerohicana]
MQVNLFDPDAPKKSTNLSINSDLLRQAKERRINLSKTLEARLAEMLREDYCQNWNEENKDAIDDYNRRVTTHGTFGDGRRRF